MRDEEDTSTVRKKREKILTVQIPKEIEKALIKEGIDLSNAVVEERGMWQVDDNTFRTVVTFSAKEEKKAEVEYEQ